VAADTSGVGRRLARLLEEEEGSEALAALVEAAAKLRETGLLDLLVVLADHYEELLSTASGEEAGALAALGEAVARGAARGGALKASPTVERATACLVEALAPEEVEKAQPLGVTGLLRALSDPQVARGLGILVHLARRLGACFTPSSQAGGTGQAIGQ
jgi:uncharacterized protein YjgD (DUF1641 family)